MHKTHGRIWARRSIFARAKSRLAGLWSRRRLSPTLSGETQLKLDFLTDKGQELRNAGTVETGARAPERCHGSGNASSEYSEYAGNLPFCDDQAVALRRRRLSDPVAAFGDPIQYAGMSQRLGGGRQAPAGAGSGRRYPAAHFLSLIHI